MNLLQAIILGIVQGLTEFIPISSTAHLVFASRLTNLYNGDPQQITATMAVIQLGTLGRFLFILLPIFLIFQRRLSAIIGLYLTNKRRQYVFRHERKRPMWLSDDAWLGWLIIFGSIPVGDCRIVI